MDDPIPADMAEAWLTFEATAEVYILELAAARHAEGARFGTAQARALLPRGFRALDARGFFLSALLARLCEEGELRRETVGRKFLYALAASAPEGSIAGAEQEEGAEPEREASSGTSPEPERSTAGAEPEEGTSSGASPGREPGAERERVPASGP